MDYSSMIHTAITYIDCHIENAITGKDVAKHSGYSYYHFSRIFLTYQKEALGQYIINKKLLLAAKKLLETDKKIVDIAIESGFKSPQAFTHAFKKNFKLAPYYYRFENKKQK